MANKRQSNGILDTLQRLFGSDEQRSLLSKYVSSGIFKHHLVQSKKTIFIRSNECDNLIKNVLALDVILGSQNEVIKVIKGEMSSSLIKERLHQERLKLDTKFKAYGYWLNRIPSLQALLNSEFDFQTAAIEDKLSSDVPNDFLSQSSPYALRAVRLLEKVEEDGRLSKLNSQQLSDKAWALYRLGLYEQAVDIAYVTTAEDPSCSECWMLLAINLQREQRDASEERSRYALERENAEPLSAHESWAEEMESDAADKYVSAKDKERKVIFPALLHWPKDEKSPRSGFKYPENRQAIRKACIEWLFTLISPSNGFCHNIDLSKSYEINGLGPEHEMWRKEHSFMNFTHRSNLPPIDLSDIELQVAEIALSELKNPLDWIQPFTLQSMTLRLKLLHIRFVLNLGDYQQVRDQFLEDLRIFSTNEALKLIHNHNLFSALITHLSSNGFADLQKYLKCIGAGLKSEVDDKTSLIELNFLRKSYDHAFVRDQYDNCLDVATQALEYIRKHGDKRPRDLSNKPTDTKSNNLSEKFWQYLALRAGVLIKQNDDNVELIKSTLLSIEHPAEYFNDESAYMVVESDEFEDWYSPPYGDSIITNGEWLNALKSIAEYSDLSEKETLLTQKIVSNLEDLFAETPSWEL